MPVSNPTPRPGRLWGNDKHRMEPMGPRRPDAHHPGLFMPEAVLEEKCENAFSEHGGQARSDRVPGKPYNRGKCVAEG